MMIKSYGIKWQQIKHLPHTYVLLAFLTASYIFFTFSLEFQTLSLIIGLIISLVTWTIWITIIPVKITKLKEQNKENLLVKEVFQNKLKKCELDLGKILTTSQWKNTLSLVGEIHNLVTHINETDPTFFPELLEILHSTLEISQEIANCLVASQTVTTKVYSEKIAQNLNIKVSQLEEIWENLAQLRDKLVMSGLEFNRVNGSKTLKQLLSVLNEDSRDLLE